MVDSMSAGLKFGKAVGAILGAAYGDALGWPNERAVRSKILKQPQHPPLHELREWTRRSGGRFFPHEETISIGEYSDDTQLILCLCRSLAKGNQWWDYFTRVELPFWSTYERGGGAATKRAVSSWIDGIAPWDSNRDSGKVKKYFDAGGNGVAMRVLPHVLYLGEKSFPETAKNIFLDGIATHGHPRALLGALAYGFALWSALRKDSVLAYGELIEEVIKNENLWSSIPSDSKIKNEWWNQTKKHVKNYPRVWKETKMEILEYLDICRTELSKESLSFDDNVLEKLQCFNKKMSGAGTVAAISAVYLASRYAADPVNGVVKAAFAVGSDTDTIASMTGGLLGCINGPEWLSSVKSNIQDSEYLEKNALLMASGQNGAGRRFDAVKRPLLKNCVSRIIEAVDASEITLPDGRKASVNRVGCYVARNHKHKVEFRKLFLEDGQTVYVKKIFNRNVKNNRQSTSTSSEEILETSLELLPKGLNLELEPPVSVEQSQGSLPLDLDKARNDLSDLVESPLENPENEYKRWINLNDKIVRANIARHLAALANYGGGHLVFGFRDDLSPDPNRPASIDKYNRDTFTGIVKHYLNPDFQCNVHIVTNKNGEKFPVVRVPGHGRVPVIAKAGGPQDEKGKSQGIVAGVHYIRKPGPGSAPISNSQEWSGLIRRCTLNDQSNLLENIASLFRSTEEAVPNVMEQLDNWHEETEKHLLHLLSQILLPNWTVPFQNNCYHLSYVISSDDEKFHLKKFRQVLEEVVNETRNTVWTGWSMFYPFNDPENKPRIYPEKADGSGGDVLEAHFMDRSRIEPHVAELWIPEFWRIAPDGRASLVRAYMEDRPYNSKILGRRPGTWLSTERVIQETAEFVTHARSLAKRFKKARQVSFRCAWTGLENREIAEFEPHVDWLRSHKSNSNKRVAERICTPMELESKWSTIVSDLCNPILHLFGFDYCSPDYVENLKPKFLKQ